MSLPSIDFLHLMLFEIQLGQDFEGQGYFKAHHDNIHLHPLTNVRSSMVPSIKSIHLTVSEIQPGQTFSQRPNAHPNTMGENNTLKGCAVIKTEKRPNSFGAYGRNTM